MATNSAPRSRQAREKSLNLTSSLQRDVGIGRVALGVFADHVVDYQPLVLFFGNRRPKTRCPKKRPTSWRPGNRRARDSGGRRRPPSSSSCRRRRPWRRPAGANGRPSSCRPPPDRPTKTVRPFTAPPASPPARPTKRRPGRPGPPPAAGGWSRNRKRNAKRRKPAGGRSPEP